MIIKMMHGWTILCLFLLAVNANVQRDLNPIVLDSTSEELKTYIVVYKETDPITILTASDATYTMAESSGGEVIFDYDAVLNGAAVTLPASAAEQLKHNDSINLVYEDLPAYADTTSWGLDRIDQNDLPLDSNYRFETNRNGGDGVNVCVIDSGIDEDYIGGYEIDVAGGENFVLPTSGGVVSWDDCFGHGTHVAGTIGSRSYGVAPGVTLWAIRVLNCDGLSSASIVIAGINWCAQKARELGGKWLANLSLGVFSSDPAYPLNRAVEFARAQGVLSVVSAGNEGIDACFKSPANVPSAITVAASTVTDDRWKDPYRGFFSNFGQCVDMFAPGNEILSLSLRDPGHATQPTLKTGTSMATPHVTGAAALFYQGLGSVDAVEAVVKAAAVPDRITDVVGAPNLLVQVPFSLAGTAPAPTNDKPKKKGPKQAKAGKVRARRHRE